MEVVLRTGQAVHDEEVIIERPDGSRVPVLVNIAPLYGESGQQIGAVNCFQDLRSQKQSEQEREGGDVPISVEIGEAGVTELRA
jgi:PAS domain S-box-containing protein